VSAISLIGVRKLYGSAVAVDGVSFEVESGRLTVLLGPSGCGKSTCLRLIAGLDALDAGTIMLGGKDAAPLEPARRGVAMVFQSYALFPHLSVADNITFGLKVRGVARADRNRRLAEIADLVNLSPYLTRKPAQLSGGQRQRVALARAIIGDPQICLMDEPLSNLDAQLRHEMRLEIRALQQRLGMTMVYVTHDQVEAMTMADQIVLMRDGRIEQMDHPATLYASPATSFVGRFIGSPPMNLIRVESDPPSLMRGIRPEHVRIGRPGVDADAGAQLARFSGSIESVEYLGADSIVTVTCEFGRIVARVAGQTQFRTGENLAVCWERSFELAFDEATGRRLAGDGATSSRVLHAVG
jgi:sn-glycerol 3-phosphate transport system ATP-binding protein